MTATRSLSASLQQLGRALQADELAEASDGELVGRFVDRRDQSAFAALVRRHGPVVLGVCRRVLRHEQDAEDAFQATFLVFARNAPTVQRAGAIGNWLYGVAHNVARKARASRLRRDAKEREAVVRQPGGDPADCVNDLRDILDSELGALPDKYRAPVVLCDLGGLTTEQAAAAVGCPPKTLGTRLRRARGILARRLTRRGIALTAGGLPQVLAPHATAAVPAQLLSVTAQAATDPATVTPAVAALTIGVPTGMMTLTSLKHALLTCAGLAAGGLVTVPVVQHLHAAHQPRQARTSTAQPAGSEHERLPAEPPANIHLRLHRFFMGLIHGEFFTAAADEKKDDKLKTLAGTWVKKEGELRITFEKTEPKLKISPHGKDEVILILCDYTADKDGLVKAKITGFEGKAEAKKALSEKLPVGTEFSFKWGTKEGAATLSEVKGEKVDLIKSHLEGDFEEKK